jgi:hypothetical protein
MTAPSGHRVRRSDEVALRRRQKAEAEPRQEALLAKRLDQIRALFVGDREWTIGAIAAAIGSGIHPTTSLVRHLQASGEIVGQMRGGHKDHFRRATPADVARMPHSRSIAVPDFDAGAFKAALADVLASGASYTIQELARAVRGTWPQADSTLVETAIESLLEVGTVERLALGSVVRYRRAQGTPQ